MPLAFTQEDFLVRVGFDRPSHVMYRSCTIIIFAYVNFRREMYAAFSLYEGRCLNLNAWRTMRVS